MKKYLLLLAGLMILAPYGQAEAKAVKLGRGNAYSVAADAKINSNASQAEFRKGECESNEECPSDKKCMGYKCVDVCTQPTGQPGMSLARICGGKKCIADPNTPHAFKCVDSCYNVVCKSGYTTEVTSDGCCCVATSCPSGQRLENGKCVANCTGVTCKSGYKAVSNSTGCCCEEDTPTCSAAQVYHPTLKKCVAAVCPANCADMCSKGYCTSCKSGYTLGSDGMCAAESSCPVGQRKIGGVCTACQSGETINCATTGAFRISNGLCCALPEGCSAIDTSVKSDGSFDCSECKIGYTLSAGKCTKLSLGLQCTEVPGRGCCTAAQLADPNMACFQTSKVEVDL